MWEEKQTENVFCENKSCLFLLISTKKKKKKRIKNYYYFLNLPANSFLVKYSMI